MTFFYYSNYKSPIYVLSLESILSLGGERLLLREQDNWSTEQFVNTSFETTRRQILRQLVDAL